MRLRSALLLAMLVDCKQKDAVPDAAPLADVAAPLPLGETQSIERHLGAYVKALYARTYDEDELKPFLAPEFENAMLARWKKFRDGKRAVEAQVRWGPSKLDEKGAHLVVYEHWASEVNGLEVTHDFVAYYDLTLDPRRRVLSHVPNGALIGKKKVPRATCMPSCMDRLSAWELPPKCANDGAPRARVKVGDVVGDLGETTTSANVKLRKVMLGRDQVWLVDCLDWVKESDGGLGFLDEPDAATP